tara:strand:- start:1595 stop:2569 length:975 start_codon:yes stop_codon:yes gene_type:complete
MDILLKFQKHIVGNNTALLFLYNEITLYMRIYKGYIYIYFIYIYMTLELRKFDMSKIKFNANENAGPVVVLIGRRDTGKSFLVRDLLFHQQDIPIGTVISGTEAGNGFYSEHIPKLFIHEEYNSAIIENILKRQKAVLKNMKKERLMNSTRNTNDPRTFCILDDCLYDATWTKDKLMRALFMNGRHWKIMLCITMQYPLGIPPNLRTNIDYVFILREPYIANRKRIWENYAGMFPTFESFCQVMDQCTENYECLVIDNNAKSNQLRDQIFWYKAESHPPFKLGSKEFWDFSKDLDSDDEAPYDPNNSRKRNSGPTISVKKANKR